MVLTLILLAFPPSPVSASEALAPNRAIGQYSIRVHGPSAIDDTVGVIRIFTFRGDLDRTVRHIRSQASRQDWLEEFAGFSGMRYFWSSADHSLNWSADLTESSGHVVRRQSGVGLFRDFRATNHRVEHPYGLTPVGQKAKGWISAYTFDGEFVDRQ